MKRCLQTTLFVLIISCLTGCAYYKTRTKSNPGKDDISWAQYNGKSFFIHTGNKVYDLANISIQDDTLAGTLGNEWINYKFLQKHPDDGSFGSQTSHILNEVHLFLMSDSISSLNQSMLVKIPYADISKLDTYKSDLTRTFMNAALTVIAIPATALAILLILPNKDDESSCPYVYAMQDTSWQMVGEIFGGAVYRPLERDDYMLLPDADTNSTYSLQVSNELSEIQYINQLSLKQVNHAIGTKVIPHRNGLIYTVSDPHLPEKAVSSSGADLLPLLAAKDQLSFLFDNTPEETGDTCAFNTVELTFTPPSGIDSLKLVIRGGNQMWADYQISNFTQLYGKKYDNWIKKQAKTDGSSALKWQHDQRLFLDVFVETDTGWMYYDFFQLTGPQGRRELVMPLPVLKNDNLTMKIKLVSGFMFWELDYAALDYTANQSYEVIDLKSVTALTETGRNVSKEISENDNEYYIQKERGEKLVITYNSPQVSAELESTLLLHSKGYYEHVRDYTGKPDIETLLSYTRKGQLSKVSYKNFIELNRNSLVTVGK